MSNSDKLQDRNQFLETNINLLHKFMADYYVPSEYYGPLSVRYIKIADRYLQENKLQQYAFSTVLWLNLRSELYELQRKAKADSSHLSLDDTSLHLNTLDDYSSIFLWSVLEKELTSVQLKTLQLRQAGKTNREIAALHKVGEKAVERRFSRIRKKLTNILSKH